MNSEETHGFNIGDMVLFKDEWGPKDKDGNKVPMPIASIGPHPLLKEKLAAHFIPVFMKPGDKYPQATCRLLNTLSLVKPMEPFEGEFDFEI